MNFIELEILVDMRKEKSVKRKEKERFILNFIISIAYSHIHQTLKTHGLGCLFSTKLTTPLNFYNASLKNFLQNGNKKWFTNILLWA